MNTLILNGLSSTPFTLVNFSRNTSFTNGMRSIAYFDLENTTNTVATLQSIGLTSVTNITIKHDNEVIYNLPNLSAQITSINESLVDDHINISVSITFN